MTVKRLSWQNLIAYGMIVLAAAALLLCVAFSFLPDAVNYIFAPFRFNTKHATEKHPLVSLNLKNPNKNDFIKNERGYGTDAEQMYLYENKYSKGMEFVFKVNPDEIYDTSVGYDLVEYWKHEEVARREGFRYIFCRQDGMWFFAKIPYNEDAESIKGMKGIFTPFPEYAIDDIILSFGPNQMFINNLFPYQFDATTSLTETGILAVVSFLLFFAAAAAAVTWLLNQIINKEKRPLYKKLHLMGWDEYKIDEQLENAKWENKTATLENWVIKKGFFKTQIDLTKKL